MPDRFSEFLAANDDGFKRGDAKGDVAFVARVRAALEAVEQSDFEEPPKSIASFLKRYRISRSVLYEKYKYLQPEILSVLKRLNARKRERAGQCVETIASVKRDAKAAVAKAYSTSYSHYLSQSGPIAQEQRALILQNQALMEKNTESERIIVNQSNIISSLTHQLNNLMRENAKLKANRAEP